MKIVKYSIIFLQHYVFCLNIFLSGVAATTHCNVLLNVMKVTVYKVKFDKRVEVFSCIPNKKKETHHLELFNSKEDEKRIGQFSLYQSKGMLGTAALHVF